MGPGSAPPESDSPRDHPGERLRPRVSQAVLDMVHNLTGLESTFLTEVSVARDEQRVLQASNRGPLDLQPEARPHSWEDSVCRRALETGTWATDDIERDVPGSSVGAALGLRSYLAVPVRASDGEVVATLCGASTRAVEVPAGARPAMLVLAQLLSEQWAADHASGRRDEADSRDDGAEAAGHVLRLAEAEHQLKSPLSVIAGWAELLLTDWAGLSADRREHGLQSILSASRRAASQVEDLLADARGDQMARSLKSEPVDLSALVADVGDQLSGYARNHQTVVDAVPGVWIDGDADAAWQLLWHLAENAVKYSPDGGVIAARMSVSGDRAVITIDDEGVGVPTDVDVFSPFVRGGSAAVDTPGSGLGLHIVHRLATAMKGTVAATRRPERGSRFTVTLPVRDAPRNPDGGDTSEEDRRDARDRTRRP